MSAGRLDWSEACVVLWLVAESALSLTATLLLVHRTVALPKGGTLSTHYFATWAVTWGGTMFVLAVIAGAFAFRRVTPWNVVLTWPWAVGPAVGIASFAALTGQMDGGSKLCTLPKGDSCDTSWGFGMILLSIAAAGVLGGTFIAVASLKRLLSRALFEVRSS